MAEGQTAGRKIERFAGGDDQRTARSASVMNEIIDWVNALLQIELKPAKAGKVLYSDSNVVIDVSNLKGFPDPPTEGTWVLGAIDGVVQWIETTDCSGIDGGEA